MFKRMLMLVVPFVLVLGGFSFTANAESNNKKDIEVTVTNDETGETRSLDSKEINNLDIDTFNTDNPNEKGYEVFIPLNEDESSDGVTPFVEDGSSKKESGVTAKLYIDYNKNSKGQIRVNKVRGSWNPSSNMYSVTNKKVIAHNGGLPGKKISKTPTSNSFSYKTGWGYQNTADGADGPMAESTAKIKVSGMSGSHTINLRTFTEY